MYQNPASQLVAGGGDPSSLDQDKVNEEFEDFYEEIFEELGTFGKLEEVLVCDNLGDHMVGNVYAKFEDEEDADKALKALFGRFYAGRPLVCEFSPVTDFREARCRQFDENTCTRGGYCNFMHIKHVPRSLAKQLRRDNEREHHSSSSSSRRSRSRSRSRDHHHHRSSGDRERRSDRGHDHDREERSSRRGRDHHRRGEGEDDRRSSRGGRDEERREEDQGGKGGGEEAREGEGERLNNRGSAEEAAVPAAATGEAATEEGRE